MAHPQPHPPTIRDWIALLILTVLWGSAFAVVKHGVETFPPGALITVRIAVAAMAITLYTYARGRRLPPLRDKRWLWFAAIGFFGNTLPFYLISWGQQHIDSALAGILVSTMPLVTVVMAHAFVPGEHLTARRLIGVLIGFAGVVVLLGPSALTRLGGTDTLAQIGVVLAATCYAINAILARLLPDTPPSVSASGMMIAASIFAIPIGLSDIGQATGIVPTAWAAVLWLALAPTAFAAVLLMRIAATAGPNFLAIVNYLTPVAAVITGLLIGESIGLNAWLALGIILAGVWLSQTRPKPLANPHAE
ncbi:DMT family transporter [Maricaulis sp. CAU 1757]